MLNDESEYSPPFNFLDLPVQIDALFCMFGVLDVVRFVACSVICQFVLFQLFALVVMTLMLFMNMCMFKIHM